MSHSEDFAIVELHAGVYKNYVGVGHGDGGGTIAMSRGLFYLPIPESLITSGAPDLAGSLEPISI